MRYFLLAALALLIAVPAAHSSASRSQTPACGSIDRLGLEKQMNAHAAQILAACGRAPASGFDATVGFFGGLGPAPSAYGGTDVDVVTGGEGVYPQVTQSESQTWAQGSTVVMAYNDSRTAPICYSGGSYSLNGGTTWTNLNSRPFCSGHGTGFGDPVVVYDARNSTWIDVDLASGCGGQGLGVWRSADGVTWTIGPCAHSGGSDDRESGWVDNNLSSPFYGRMYLTWNNFAAGQFIYSIYSNDGGLTWSAPVQVQSGGFIRNVQVTTGPDGTVFIAGMNEGAGGLGSRINMLFRTSSTARRTAARAGRA